MNNKINEMKLPVTLKDVEAAVKNIAGDVVRTKLLNADHLSQLTGAEVYIKPENMQRVKSFKIRGALNRIKNLTTEQKAKGVIAPSAGNHAQGVALAGTLAGVKTYIVMPESAPLEKVQATKGYGGEVIFVKGNFDDARAMAQKLEKEKGYTFVCAFDDKDVIAGQGTIAIEILEDLPSVDVVVCPVGGGGLIAGLAVVLKSINPNIKLIGVEPTGFECMQQSVKTKKICKLNPAFSTIADGTAVRQPGTNTFKICSKLVDQIVTVTEHEIQDAMDHLLEKCKLVVEGAGALASAALIANKIKNIKGKKVVSLITGGNVDIDRLLSAVTASLSRKGKSIPLSIELNSKNVNKFFEILAKFSGVAYDIYGAKLDNSYQPNEKYQYSVVSTFIARPDEKQKFLTALASANFKYQKVN